MQIIDRLRSIFADAYSNDPARQLLMFRLLSLVLALIAFIMSVMNLFTDEITLLYVTAAYSLICVAVYILSKRRVGLAKPLFMLATLAMLSAFIITGIPDGFSVLWTLLIPGCALYIFGCRRGTLFSTVLFLMILFFFWLPLGQGLLRYEYSATFMLRFPLVYVCMYLISFYVEWIRMKTFQRMEQAEDNYRQLYRHDALTGLCSRHAFYEDAARLREVHREGETSVLMVDIDDFKSVNDQFGHIAGDEVLRKAARVIEQSICEHCLACRWGGEEFLVMMQCHHSPYGIAERIRTTVESSYVPSQEGAPIRFTVSVGVATGPIGSMEQMARLIDQADQAMYASKNQGKNRTSLLKADG